MFSSVIVDAELAHGGVKRPSARLTAALALRAVFGELDIKPLEADAVRHYALLRHQLEQAGTPISANDMFIAAHVLSLDATLVTDNGREFMRVGGLRVENWLR